MTSVSKKNFICDDKDFVNVNINIPKEKRAIYHTIKTMVFENDGCVFGGMVRDEIISEHNKKIFDEFINSEEGKNTSSGNKSNDFWNKDFHKETSCRLIVPYDMDVYFNTAEKASAFIVKIKDIFSVIEKGQRPITYSGNLSQLSMKKLDISFVLGKTFTFKGYTIGISLDIIYPSSNLFDLEPPFNNLDMLCNGFIQGKDGIKRLSKNTGTPLDKMDTLEKTIATANILKDMIQFKTEICRKFAKKEMQYCVLRVMNMLKRKTNSWTIKNLPYRVIKYENYHEDESLEDKQKDCCPICQEKIKFEDIKDSICIVFSKKEKMQENGIAVTEYIPGSKLHHNCLIDYIVYEAKKYKYVPEEGNVYTVKCPQKNPIIFRNCYKHIKWDRYLTI